MTNKRDLTCKERVKDAFISRMEDIKTLYKANKIEELKQYALSIDQVPAYAFDGQNEGYRRYQISWGGPSEEFRLFTYGRMEFWLMDWFDGACVPVTGRNKTIIADIIKRHLINQ